MVFTFPIVFGDDTPRLVVYDTYGNELNDTLDENTYASFGSVPKNTESHITLYLRNPGSSAIYSVKVEGVESSNQLGDADDTYEALNTPQELGVFNGRETKELDLYWSVPDDSTLGIKVFGIQALNSDDYEFIDNHEYFKKITITNNDLNPMIDFQVKINFDNTFDWANTTSDGRDLRFYDTDFKELPHFIRLWSAALTTGVVYVKVPKIEVGESIDIYLGYGKFDLVSTSTPEALLFYEKFTDGFYNEWANTGTLTYSFTNSGIQLLTATAAGTGLVAAFPYYLNVAFDVAMTRTANTVTHRGGLWAVKEPTHDVSPTTGSSYRQGLAWDYGASGSSTRGYYGNDNTAPVGTSYGRVELFANGTIKSYWDASDTPTTPTLKNTDTHSYKFPYLMLTLIAANHPVTIHYIYAYKIPIIAPTVTFAAVADITAEFTNPDVDSGVCACVGNIIKQLEIYDVDFRNVMYEIGDFNATWRLPGTEGITIWGIYQPRPVGDYYFPEMDNLGINDALFFTVTDYLVDIHDKIDIEGVRFDLQAIQVHPIADQKIYKMCVLKRQPEYYATAKGVVS